MTDLTKLADALEIIAFHRISSEYPQAQDDLQEAARILRAAAAVDVQRLLFLAAARDGAYAEWRLYGGNKRRAQYDEVCAALESALRLALAAREGQPDELPMQPIVLAQDGVIRFKENRLVSKLLEHSRAHGFGLNELAAEDATPEERAQLAQLIGYSVSGWGGLSYVSDESADKADAIAEAMIAAAPKGTP